MNDAGQQLVAFVDQLPKNERMSVQALRSNPEVLNRVRALLDSFWVDLGNKQSNDHAIRARATWWATHVLRDYDNELGDDKTSAPRRNLGTLVELESILYGRLRRNAAFRAVRLADTIGAAAGVVGTRTASLKHEAEVVATAASVASQLWSKANGLAPNANVVDELIDRAARSAKRAEGLPAADQQKAVQSALNALDEISVSLSPTEIDLTIEPIPQIPKTMSVEETTRILDDVDAAFLDPSRSLTPLTLASALLQAVFDDRDANQKIYGPYPRRLARIESVPRYETMFAVNVSLQFILNAVNQAVTQYMRIQATSPSTSAAAIRFREYDAQRKHNWALLLRAPPS